MHLAKSSGIGKIRMRKNTLELGWIPDDCQWVVVTPSGHILGKRFTSIGQAERQLSDLQEIWNRNDSSESDYTDVDFE